jgi:hypothetical protein
MHRRNYLTIRDLGSAVIDMEWLGDHPNNHRFQLKQICNALRAASAFCCSKHISLRHAGDDWPVICHWQANLSATTVHTTLIDMSSKCRVPLRRRLPFITRRTSGVASEWQRTKINLWFIAVNLSHLCSSHKDAWVTGCIGHANSPLQGHPVVSFTIQTV